MTPIPYTLIRSDRKSIGIQITADGVLVLAPCLHIHESRYAVGFLAVLLLTAYCQ